MSMTSFDPGSANAINRRFKTKRSFSDIAGDRSGERTAPSEQLAMQELEGVQRRQGGVISDAPTGRAPGYQSVTTADVVSESPLLIGSGGGAPIGRGVLQAIARMLNRGGAGDIAKRVTQQAAGGAASQAAGAAGSAAANAARRAALPPVSAATRATGPIAPVKAVGAPAPAMGLDAPTHIQRVGAARKTGLDMNDINTPAIVRALANSGRGSPSVSTAGRAAPRAVPPPAPAAPVAPPPAAPVGPPTPPRVGFAPPPALDFSRLSIPKTAISAATGGAAGLGLSTPDEGTVEATPGMEAPPAAPAPTGAPTAAPTSAAQRRLSFSQLAAPKTSSGSSGTDEAATNAAINALPQVGSREAFVQLLNTKGVEWSATGVNIQRLIQAANALWPQ